MNYKKKYLKYKLKYLNLKKLIKGGDELDTTILAAEAGIDLTKDQSNIGESEKSPYDVYAEDYFLKLLGTMYLMKDLEEQLTEEQRQKEINKFKEKFEKNVNQFLKDKKKMFKSKKELANTFRRYAQENPQEFLDNHTHRIIDKIKKNEELSEEHQTILLKRFNFVKDVLFPQPGVIANVVDTVTSGVYTVTSGVTSGVNRVTSGVTSGVTSVLILY